jgi:hypothetical protein
LKVHVGLVYLRVLLGYGVWQLGVLERELQFSGFKELDFLDQRFVLGLTAPKFAEDLLSVGNAWNFY